jgi:hypothetical protein
LELSENASYVVHAARIQLLRESGRQEAWKLAVQQEANFLNCDIILKAYEDRAALLLADLASALESHIQALVGSGKTPKQAAKDVRKKPSSFKYYI